MLHLMVYGLKDLYIDGEKYVTLEYWTTEPGSPSKWQERVRKRNVCQSTRPTTLTSRSKQAIQTASSSEARIDHAWLTRSQLKESEQGKGKQSIRQGPS